VSSFYAVSITDISRMTTEEKIDGLRHVLDPGSGQEFKTREEAQTDVDSRRTVSQDGAALDRQTWSVTSLEALAGWIELLEELAYGK